VIIGGRLSVKLPNFPYPLDVDTVVQIRSLHDCTKKLICTAMFPNKKENREKSEEEM